MVTPLLRRIRVKRNVETVLEAEGVLIDAIGAIIAVVALEVALSPSGESLALGAWQPAARGSASAPLAGPGSAGC